MRVLPEPALAERPVEVLRPPVQAAPLVCASPHSGSLYPERFVAAAALDPASLRRTEDSFVDALFGAAPQLGVPLLRALFPRVFLDVNREPFELDPAMFDGALPPFVNAGSPRVAAGLGTIARVVSANREIYRDRLAVDEALTRIRRFYRPYHTALSDLLDETASRFGAVLLLDCHSMPSQAILAEARFGRTVDIVLGDCHGASCAPTVIAAAESRLAALGYRVTRNHPYAGGFITRYYGQPARHRHALQIEINRALYMDERRFERTAGFDRVAADMTALVATLARLDLGGAPGADLAAE